MENIIAQKQFSMIYQEFHLSEMKISNTAIHIVRCWRRIEMFDLFGMRVFS